MRRPAAAALGLLAILAAAVPAQAATVRSGPLTARTADSPWGLSFSQSGGGPRFRHLSDRRRKMRLLLFPRGRTSRSFGYGERLSSDEKPGRWYLAVRGVRTRTYTMQASLRTLRSSLRPCSVTLNGKRLSRDAWDYDAEARVLEASFRAHRAQLVVDGC